MNKTEELMLTLFKLLCRCVGTLAVALEKRKLSRADIAQVRSWIKQALDTVDEFIAGLEQK